MSARLWAMTGSLGSGKSEVEQRLRARGATVIDADQLARELTTQGHPFLHVLARDLGSEILDATGLELNRTYCRQRLSTDAAFKKKLESLLHPKISERSQELMAQALQATTAPVFYSAALLIESGRVKDFERVLLVTASLSVRLARVVKRDHVSEKDAGALAAVQASEEERRKYATYEIENSGTLEELEKKVQQFWLFLQKK